MKTLKFALIAVILSVAFAGYASDHKKNVDRIIKISIEKALEDRSLVRQMYVQLDENTLLKERSKMYIARVRYNKRIYVIYGTHKEWVAFFLMDNTIPGGGNSEGEIKGNVIH